MLQKIANLLINSLAVFISAYIIPGVVVKDFATALLVAVVLGVFNMFLKPVLIIFTLPVTILTLGLFALIINTVIILLASYIVSGFDAGSFWAAFLFGIVLSITTSILNKLVK